MKNWISRAIAAAFVLLLALPRLSAQQELSVNVRANRFINSLPDFDRYRYDSYWSAGIGNLTLRYSNTLSSGRKLQAELGYSEGIERLRINGDNFPEFAFWKEYDWMIYQGVHMALGIKQDLNKFGLYVSGQLMGFVKVKDKLVPSKNVSPKIDIKDIKDRYSPFVLQAHLNLGYQVELDPIFFYLEVGASLRGQSFLQSQNSGFRIMRNAVLGAGFEF